jgi:hypothetical protein
MSPAIIFSLQLVLGYVAWLLCFGVYIMPRLKAMDRVAAQRAIATLHSFRFFGLVFILPGVVGPHLPASFATFAAYGDLATGVLAMLALLTIKIRPLFWSFVVAFNIVGIADIILDYYLAIRVDLPAQAGQLGAGYVIPVIYVPLLMITHVVAFYFLLRPDRLRVRRERPWHEALPPGPQEPDVVRAKALARAGGRAGGRTAGQSRSPRPTETAS